MDALVFIFAFIAIIAVGFVLFLMGRTIYIMAQTYRLAKQIKNRKRFNKYE